MQRILIVAVLLASSGCGSESERVSAGIGGAPGTGGSVAAAGGAPSTGGTSSPSMGTGGTSSGGVASTGGNSPGSGGTLVSGGATSAGGTTLMSGGATASGGQSVAIGGFGNLAVYGNTTTLELAPVLLAAKSVYPGTAHVMNGGIPNLWTGADLATNAETQALVQSVTHSNLRTIFTVCEGVYRIVARKSAGINTLADLRGKRIATLPGTSSAYFLHAMLASAQLTDADVTVVATAVLSQIPAMLSGHQVDAATIWEPEIQNASDALAGDAVEFSDKSTYRELFDLHTTAEDLANPDKRRSIVEFLRSLVTASNTIKADGSTVWPLVATTTGFDSALIQKSWKYENFPGMLVPDLLDVLVQEDAWLAKSAGRAARSRADLAMLIDDTPLKEALASP